MGGRDEREPGNKGLGTAGDVDVDRGISPDVAGGTGSGDDGGRPGDGATRGDLFTRRGATEGEGRPFLPSPIPKGGGTSIKPVCVSERVPNLLMGNGLASSSEMDPTDPNEPLAVSEPCVDAKVVPDVEEDADIEDEFDVEAGSTVFDVEETEGVLENADIETDGSGEAPFACSTLPYSVSPDTSFSVSPESTEYIDPCLDLVRPEAASVVE